MENAVLIKQDINFLDKPLWFVELKQFSRIGQVYAWTDIEGYKYLAGYKLPDKVDNLILFYLLLKSQENDYKDAIVLSKYEILKACGFPTSDPKYYERIEDSLKRWKSISIEFNGTFYENGRHITIGFGIIDDYEIDKKTKLVHVNFNKHWIFKIQHSSFFKLINFEYYKALRRPVSRRLYELLCKNFKGRNECYFKLANLGSKLTLSGVKKKDGQEMIYASHVLAAIRPAIKEINKLTFEVAKKAGISSGDVFKISYKITGEKQERNIHFKKESLCEKLMAVDQEEIQEKPSKITPAEEPSQAPAELPDELKKQYDEGMTWLKQIAPDFNFKAISKMDKRELAAYFPKLKAKLERDIKKGKDCENLPGYIWECLRNKWESKPTNYGEARRKEEEEKRQQELEKKRKDIEKEHQKREQIKLEFERFQCKVAQLDMTIKKKLWAESKKNIDNSLLGKLHVPIAYSKALLKYFNEVGEKFIEEAIADLGNVKLIASEFMDKK